MALRDSEIGREKAPYFPLFLSLEGRRVVVVGGGAIACRRIADAILWHFGRGERPEDLRA